MITFNLYFITSVLSMGLISPLKFVFQMSFANFTYLQHADTLS